MSITLIQQPYNFSLAIVECVYKLEMRECVVLDEYIYTYIYIYTYTDGLRRRNKAKQIEQDVVIRVIIRATWTDL